MNTQKATVKKAIDNEADYVLPVIGARNLAILRKIALNGLLREKSLKRGIATKQCAAACNPTYREEVLKNLF